MGRKRICRPALTRESPPPPIAPNIRDRSSDRARAPGHATSTPDSGADPHPRPRHGPSTDVHSGGDPQPGARCTQRRGRIARHAGCRAHPSQAPVTHSPTGLRGDVRAAPQGMGRGVQPELLSRVTTPHAKGPRPGHPPVDGVLWLPGRHSWVRLPPTRG